jgi:tRNA dimethylallyltransferase
MKTLVVLLGPTGVGKTELCLSIAEHFNIPIINADSRQIFSEIPIGTAAPTAEQQKRRKHYFVGTHHLTDYYSAAQFEEDVMNLSGDLFNHADIALMSGGSMMYIDAVCNGIDDIPTVNEETRELLRKRHEEEGLERLCEELRILDPEYYAIVDRCNHKRVVHALEICYMTGKTYTSFRRNEKKQRPFNIIKIGITRPREELYNRINSRVEEMIKNGLEDEARKVFPLADLNALNTVGYKELFEHFRGNITLEEAIERIKCDSRRYCRKQLTWFRKDESIKWFTPNEIEEIIKFITELI